MLKFYYSLAPNPMKVALFLEESGLPYEAIPVDTRKGEARGEIASATALYEEYEDGETAEARFVRACDKLQLMIKVTVYESWGHRGLAEFWGNPANFPKSEFASIEGLFKRLQERATALPAPPARPAD